MSNALLDRLKLKYPIFLAPMAGGPSTPELAAAVSNAGGLGALGLEYLTGEQIREQMQRARQLTSGPIHAKPFAPVKRTEAAVDASAMLRELEPIHRELGIAPPTAPTLAADNLFERFEVVVEGCPELFSFTFGMFPAEHIERLKREHIPIMGTA